MPQIGPAEILVILLVGLLVFGPHRLPEIGRQVGRGMRELRRFQETVRGELDEVLHLHESEVPAAGSVPLPPPAGDLPPGTAPSGTAEPASVTAGTPPAAPAPGARAPSRFRAPGTRPSA